MDPAGNDRSTSSRSQISPGATIKSQKFKPATWHPAGDHVHQVPKPLQPPEGGKPFPHRQSALPPQSVVIQCAKHDLNENQVMRILDYYPHANWIKQFLALGMSKSAAEDMAGVLMRELDVDQLSLTNLSLSSSQHSGPVGRTPAASVPTFDHVIDIDDVSDRE